MKKVFEGSCHCGTVKYEAKVDLTAGTGRCNCTYCMKTRSWTASIAPEDFKVTAGKDSLSDYGNDWGEGNIHHKFCSKCGTNLYGHGHIAEMGGDFVGIQVNTLDNASIDELMSGDIHYSNGRNDDWMNPPDDIRAL